MGVATAEPLKAPYPWAGGKARVADYVWSRMGNCDNCVEPFMGSLAWLLRRPADHFAGGYRVETANDLNHYVVNFWRAVKAAPEAVAEWADSPVTEADLHARHKWLVRSRESAEWRERMRTDPEAFDAKIAGWWCWGLCCWIGSGWCAEDKYDRNQGTKPNTKADRIGEGIHGGGTLWTQRPNMDPGDHGVCAGLAAKVPHMDAGGRGDTASSGKRAALGNRRGVTSAVAGLAEGRPQLADAFDIGRGVNSGGALSRQVPLISGTGDGINSVAGLSQQVPELDHKRGLLAGPALGTCDARRAWLTDWMRRLSDRLRLVRTCYGHWARVCDSDSTLTRLGTTGIFLDPPYPTHRADNGKKSRAGALYSTDKGSDLNALRDEVLAWCRKWGQGEGVRVALCCYESDGYEPLQKEGWTVHQWSASGGYGNQRKGKKGKAENASRERIFFSPNCLKERQPGLFDDIGDDDETL